MTPHAPRPRKRPTSKPIPAFEATPPFPVDVADRGEVFVVSASLPGLRKQDLDVRVRKDRVQIVADFGEDDVEGSYHRRERQRGERQRIVRLPERVDERRASAMFEDGVLQVTLRKRRPKRVRVT